MNLPIVQSIMNGALRPHHLLVETTVEGKKCCIQYIYTHFKELIRKDSEIYMNSQKVYNVEDLVPYKQIANVFANIPHNLDALEAIFLKHLSQYASFDFVNEQPLCLKVIGTEQNYTEITETYFAPNVDFKLREPKTPVEKFYVGIVKAEAERIKLALMNYAKISESDIDTHGEIKQLLKVIRNYICDCVNKDIDKTLFSKYLSKELTEAELLQYDNDYSLYPVFKSLLIKLYYEIVIMFKEILKDDDYIQFEEMMYECQDRYPSDDERLAYTTAILIQNAQLAIKHNNEIKPILLEIYNIMGNQTDNKTLLNTIVALENYVFMNLNNIDIPDFKDLFDNEVNDIMKKYKDDLQTSNKDKTNPRELLEIYEAEADALSFFSENLFNANSVPRQLLAFINVQIELCKKNISSTFLPITTKTISQKNIKPKLSKRNVNDIMNAVRKRLDFFSGYNLKNEKIMKDEDYNTLIELIECFIVSKEIPSLPKKMNPNLMLSYIRYTFYLLWNDINLNNPLRNSWVEFLHAVFDFKDTQPTTTSRKFSEQPKNYDNDIKHMIQNKK